MVGTVELPPIIVRKNQPPTLELVRGRVLDVNTPHHFIVVDKGSRDGVRAGLVFNVMHGDILVGQATVARVRPQLSACDMVRTNTSAQIRVGDQAVQSGE